MMTTVTFSASGTAYIDKMIAEGKLTPGFHRGTASTDTNGGQAPSTGLPTTLQGLISTGIDATKSASEIQALIAAHEQQQEKAHAGSAAASQSPTPNNAVGSIINVSA
jgi:hypothetical protein